MVKEVTRCLLGGGALQLNTEEGCDMQYLITHRIIENRTHKDFGMYIRYHLQKEFQSSPAPPPPNLPGAIKKVHIY